MENFIGNLAFAGIVIAQFLAVVAVSAWNADMPATNDVHRGERAAGPERSRDREANRAIRSTAMLAGGR